METQQAAAAAAAEQATMREDLLTRAILQMREYVSTL